MIGDFIIKLGYLSKDTQHKIIFLEINNPYSKNYEDIKEFSYEIIKNIFEIDNPSKLCLYENNDEKITEKSEINGHWAYYQYSLLLLKK